MNRLWQVILFLVLIAGANGNSAASETATEGHSTATSEGHSTATTAESHSTTTEHAEHHCYGPVKVTSDAVGFMLISMATFYIGYKNIVYKGPSGSERFFNGFREENMIAFFVNLFAAVAYFARIIADSTCTPGFLMFTEIRYCDYLTTCPLLVLDLLWNLEAPYKCTCAGLILVTIFTGVAACTTTGAEAYLWFVYGDIIFILVYYITFIIVRERVEFFVAHAESNQAIKAMYYVKFASACFFLIWIWFPLLWIISPYSLGLIGIEVLDLLHMFLDVGAKSVYGVLLLWFRWNYDKKLLRNLDEQEFLAYDSRSGEWTAVVGTDGSPAKRAILQQQQQQKARTAGHEEYEGKGQPFRFGADLEPKSAPVSPPQGRPVSSISGLVQPFDAAALAAAQHPGHDRDGAREPLGTGSRLLFASNRRSSTAAPGPSSLAALANAAAARAAPSPFHSVSSPGGTHHPSLAGVPQLPASYVSQVPASPMSQRGGFYHPAPAYHNNPAPVSEPWLAELARALEAQGLSGPVAADTVQRLDASGILEDQLRTCISDEDLQEIGVEPSARRMILAKYRRSSFAMSRSGDPATAVEMHAWAPRLLT